MSAVVAKKLAINIVLSSYWKDLVLENKCKKQLSRSWEVPLTVRATRSLCQEDKPKVDPEYFSSHVSVSVYVCVCVRASTKT